MNKSRNAALQDYMSSRAEKKNQDSSTLRTVTKPKKCTSNYVELNPERHLVQGKTSRLLHFPRARLYKCKRDWKYPLNNSQQTRKIFHGESSGSPINSTSNFVFFEICSIFVLGSFLETVFGFAWGAAGKGVTVGKGAGGLDLNPKSSSGADGTGFVFGPACAKRHPVSINQLPTEALWCRS
uniref:Uncharacterized protein n=1 Tax=Timema cristinae TaxID=61476 RepID=A0A7R9CA86_TIMCR|nr:unnamed protein product [Timema cristinae]